MFLPEGFVDTVNEWKFGGSLSHIIGRATVRLPGIELTDNLVSTGIWVETINLDKANCRTRMLYLPNVGEVETILWD